MKCIKCGYEIPENSVFCPFCGEAFSSATPDVLSDNRCPVCGSSLKSDSAFCGCCGSKLSSSKKCEKCGSPLKEGSTFCGVCGHKTNSSYIPPSPNHNKTAKNNTGFIITVIILTILIVALCAASIIFLLFANHNKNNVASIPSVESFNSKDNFSKSGSSTDLEDDDNTTDNDEADDDYNNSDDDEYSARAVSAPYFSHISASSVRAAVNDNYYNPQNVLDGLHNTTWTEGVDGYGIGESITFYADNTQTVRGIKILNGYCKSQDLYYKNNRVKKIQLKFSNGNTYAYELPDIFDKYTVLNLNTPEYCSYVTLTILDAYAGSAYDDTCISEVLFF